MEGNHPTSSTYVEPFDSPAPGITVLCVASDESNAGAVGDALDASMESFQVLEAASESEVFDLLEAEDVDCVVSVLEPTHRDEEENSVTVANGLDFLERVRAEYDNLPLCFLAEGGTERVAAEAINGGADGYVPYDGTLDDEQVATLTERIETVVEEYRSSQKFEEATELLFRLTEYTTDTLWMFTGDWSETVVVNEAYEDIWDRQMDTLIEDPTDFLEGVHPDDLEGVQEEMENLSSGDTADLEYRIETDDGQRWASVHAEPVMDEGEVEYVAGFTRDVTELKRREERISQITEATRELPHARSEEEVAHIVADIVDSVVGYPITVYWTYDEDDEVLDAMVASESALTLADVEGPTDLPRIQAGTDEMAVFRDGDSRLVEDYGDLDSPTHPDSDLGTLLLVPVGDHGLLNLGRPEVDGFDDFDRYLAEILAQRATDALDRVDREDQLEDKRAELERSNESLKQFAYVASHDLQEPLRMVSSYVSLLDNEYGDALDEEAREYMDYAVDGATRMQEMIDALLQYSRVHTEGEEFDQVDTQAVLDETRKTLELLLEEENATVQCGDLPMVEADRSQLGQVFQNLMKNAAQHGGETSTIEVDAVEDDLVHFTVADDGPGIDADRQDKVFEIFKGNSDGTGIGLAMCKRIVNRHGGDIWVESDAGEGATFHFTFPPADEASGGASPDHTHPATTDGGLFTTDGDTV